MMPTSINGEPPPMPPPENQNPVEPETRSKQFTQEHKERVWLIMDKAALKSEQAFESNLRRYFQSEQSRIINNLEKSAKAATNKPEDLLNWQEEDDKLFGILNSLWLASFKDGVEASNNTFGFGISFDFLNPRFLDWVQTYGAEQVKDINATTRDALRKTLTEGIADGEGIPKLKNRVLGVMGEAKTSRAAAIARTETHNSVGKGTAETYKAAGVKQKEWLTTIDGRERASHAAINGEVVGISQRFSNGLEFPGDASGPAQEVINCRCVLLPII
jgi:SPP1 gp7 family putative phage head morphogenesis protein